MKKIVLIGAGGAYAESVADGIRSAANEENFSCEISVLALSKLQKLRHIDVDLILFSPPRFRALQRVKKMCPHALIDMIGMKDFALIRGNDILKVIKKTFERAEIQASKSES